MPAGDLYTSWRAPLHSWSGCQLLGGVKNSRGKLRVSCRGEVHVVLVRDLLETGEPVFFIVRSLSDAVQDVDDFVVCYAGAVE